MKYSKLIFFVIGTLLTSNLHAQVTIGNGDPPHKGAVLELKSNNKGFLGPRIQLVSANDASPIKNPAVGLLVFNIGDNGTGENKVEKEKFYFWSGSKWVEFIYEEVMEAEIKAIVDSLGIPQSAVFHLNGANIIDNSVPTAPVMGMFDVMKGAGLGIRKRILLKETINETGGKVRLWSNEFGDAFIIFKKGVYSITFAYQFIPSVNAYPNKTTPIGTCTASSYFVDFPLEVSGIQGDRARIHNVAYHMTGRYAHHGGAISYVVKIEEDDRPWQFQLGAGQSGSNCNTDPPGNLAIEGFSLMNDNTFVLVSRIGD